MRTQQTLSEIREINLSYLMLAQSLLRDDRESAIYQLGVTAETADLILQMTNSQICKVAQTTQLLCSMRFGDDMVFSLLTDHGKRQLPAGYDMLHAGIIHSGQFAEAL